MLFELESENNDISSSQIKKKRNFSLENTSFFDVVNNYLTELENNNKSSRLFLGKVRHVLNYIQSKQLTFQEINETFLKQFSSYLKNKTLSERSIINNLVVIRTLFNKSIKMQIVDRKHYPFGGDKIRIKFPETNKGRFNNCRNTKIEN